MTKTPPMNLPVHRTPKNPGDHIIINPFLREWLEAKQRKAA